VRQKAYPEARQFLGREIGGETVVGARPIGVGRYEFITEAPDGVQTRHEVEL
jgi:hypothetical protein